jgi:hypothetical protein
MSHAKQASKRKDRTKAVTVLGVAGALSLAGGVSKAAVGPSGDTLTDKTAITLDEEERARRPGLQFAQRTRSRPRQGCGGCGGCSGGPTACATCAGGGGPDGM